MITISYADRLRDMSPEDKEALSESANHWGRSPMLTNDEVIALAQAKDAGSVEARNELVTRNMQLVIRIARGWVGRGVPFEDLVQEGAIGLMRAADLFDWTLGNKFSTFAGLRIVAACQRAIENQAETIRIPVHTRTSGRCAPEAERARAILSGDADRKLGLSLGAEGRSGSTIFSRMADPSANTEAEALAAVMAENTAGEIATALLTLNPQERAIIEARYLTGSPDPVTMAIVARGLGISKQRVEQVQKVAFEKLRNALQGVESGN